MDRSSIFDAIVKLHKGKDDQLLFWPVDRPIFEGNAASVIAPHLTGPGINIEDIGPLSPNLEDRRGENYTPGLLDAILSTIRDVSYNTRAQFAANPAIDASTARMKQLHGITPVLQELVRREQGFRLLDEGSERPVREEIKREHKRLKDKKRDD